MSGKVKKRSRQPTCARCRNHGVVSPLKGHKRFCHFSHCSCPNCQLIAQKRDVSSKQIALRRRQQQDEAAGISLPVPETMLNSNTTESNELHLLKKRFPEVHLGRLFAVLTETGSLKQAVERLTKEEAKQSRLENTWTWSSEITANPATPVPSLASPPPPFTVRPPLTNPKTELPPEYCASRFYPQPPRYNPLYPQVYGGLPYYNTNPTSPTPSPFCTSFDPQQQLVLSPTWTLNPAEEGTNLTIADSKSLATPNSDEETEPVLMIDV